MTMTKQFPTSTTEPVAAMAAHLAGNPKPNHIVLETLAKKIESVIIEVPEEQLAALDITTHFANHQSLSTAHLATLNQLTPWSTAMLFAGHLQGGVWNATKRTSFQTLPDSHLELIAEHLQDRRVLEIGCHEGYYSLGMACFARKIVAVDGRVENVVKTLIRAWLAGALDRIEPVCHDFESASTPTFAQPDASGLCFDLIHHNGVLYHLSNPLQHLAQLLDANPAGSIFLDTHVALEAQLNSQYQFAGNNYPAYAYREPAKRDTAPFAGLTPMAYWLRREDLISFLHARGFTRLLIDEFRQERNGGRVRLLAAR